MVLRGVKGEGVQGQKYKLILYESVFQYEVSTFYGMSIASSVLEIFAIEYGWVCRILVISLIFSHIKNRVKNGLNTDFLGPKCLLGMVFLVVLHVSPCTRP